VLLIGIAFMLARALSRAIARPVVNLTRIMGALASGDNSVDIPDVDRADEMGAMARAVLVFRDNAVAKAQSESDQAHVVEAIGQGLEALAAGNMTYTIEEPFAGTYDRLRQAFNRSVAGLEASLSQVAASAQGVYGGTTEIRAASEDLARRTERQAASIEETASATREVTDMVSGTAQGTAELRQAISAVKSDATDGSTVVRNAVSAMSEIEKSSYQIGEIINVIDGIAFQTNLLALNAGVEAARAGESGKGFAVVADEVRGLAQRSAGAAKDIKSLINNSTEQVAQGVALVAETGTMLDRILIKISDVTALISKIAVATDAQSTHLREVNASVVQMDEMTQQNAAMVEETTACTRNLASQADQLAELVRRFRLRVNEVSVADAVSAGSLPKKVAPRPAPVPRMPVAGNLAVKPAEDEWSAF
jgi:methyl-accepting chemotaxis protein